MSLRFRRSKGLGKYARVSVSKTGVGFSVGGRGARISKHSSGRTTRSVGAPGTGVHFRKDTMSGSRSRSTAAKPTPAAAASAAAPARPGLFAPKAEKQLYRAVASTDVVALDAVADRFPGYRRLALTLAGALSADDDPSGSARRFVAAREAPWTAEEAGYVGRYLAHLSFDVSVAPGVDLDVPVTDLAAIMAVTATQDAGDHAGAAALADELDLSDPGYRVVAAASHNNAGNDGRVVELSDGIANADNTTMLLLTLRAGAFRRQGLLDAARETLREALKSKAREPGLRHMTLLERAKVYAAQGRNAQARKDLEHILADDSSVKGVRELLDELTP